MDIDSIEPGLDFVQVLREQVDQCDVFLAVIGPNWLEARDETGNRRLNNPSDFVRIEIEAALAKAKKVVPVLVSGAEMPPEKDLPETLRPFSRRHAVRLTNERFKSDVLGLVKQLEKALLHAEAARREKERAQRIAERLPGKIAKVEEISSPFTSSKVIGFAHATLFAFVIGLSMWGFLRSEYSDAVVTWQMQSFMRIVGFAAGLAGLVSWRVQGLVSKRGFAVRFFFALFVLTAAFASFGGILRFIYSFAKDEFGNFFYSMLVPPSPIITAMFLLAAVYLAVFGPREPKSRRPSRSAPN